jgi:aminoglycoside phosphotransferase (APT) family kinase protein
MSAGAAAPTEEQLDPERLRSWLADEVDPSVAAVTVRRMAAGHSSGAWRVDTTIAGQPRAMVLKAPGLPSVVHQRDAAREGLIVDALHRFGAPVPAVLAIDPGSQAVGRPCFVMELVDGRAVADTSPGGYHDDPDLQAAGAHAQGAVWESFHDALAALHSIDAREVPAARVGEGGTAAVLAYWREALLDEVPADAAPRQLALLDWLETNIPPGADDSPAVCLGDARLVNGLLSGTEIRALVDFEVAYVGNPAADVGYSLFFDGLHQRGADVPLALPSPEATWGRWSRATGRPLDHCEYWTAFGATILCVTASRAMVQWGLSTGSLESDNPVVADWESAAERAAR